MGAASVRAPMVGAGVRVVGAKVVDGAGVGHLATSATCTTPHEVEAHGVSKNAEPRSTSSSTHQPMSWSKAEAE